MVLASFGCRNKQNIAQIKGHIDIVVIKRSILIRDPTLPTSA